MNAKARKTIEEKKKEIEEKFNPKYKARTIIFCKDGIIIYHGYRGSEMKLTYQCYSYDDFNIVKEELKDLCNVRAEINPDSYCPFSNKKKP